MKKPILAAYCAHQSISRLQSETIKNLDIIYYAFASVIDKDIVIRFPEDMEQIKAIKKEHPNLRVILCVGGGGCGARMSEAVADNESFLRLIDRMIEEMVKYGFDGIDLDWEFPTTTGHPEERQLHTEMLRILREKLDAMDRKYYLSVAVPDCEWTFRITELDESQKYLDYINVMTYDMNRKDCTSHHSAPYSADDTKYASAFGAVKRYKKHNVPNEKIIIGGAFYSKKWSNISSNGNGLHIPIDAPIAYGPCFTDLKENYIDKNGYKKYWDDEAKAPFLYNGEEFITYEDEESLGHKCDIVVNENIYGIMVWEFGGDKEQYLLPFMRKRLDALASAKYNS